MQRMDLQVQGRKLAVRDTRPEIGFVQITSQRMFRVNTPEDEDQALENFESQEGLDQDKKPVTNAKVHSKKGKTPKEIIVFQRKQKDLNVEERQPIQISSQVYPSYSILIDLCKHKYQTIEDIKKVILPKPSKIIQENENNFSYSEFDKYLSSAYYELYEQHINNAKDAIYKLHPSSSSKKTEQNLEKLHDESKRVSSAPH